MLPDPGVVRMKTFTNSRYPGAEPADGRGASTNEGENKVIARLDGRIRDADAMETADYALLLARRHLASAAEHEGLQARWEAEFAALRRLHGQARFQSDWDADGPLTRILTELDAAMEAQYWERARIAEELSARPAGGLVAAVAKVAVALHQIDAGDDGAQARALLTRTLVDFEELGLAIHD